MTNEMRFCCNLSNIPLDDELKIRSFCLTPIDESQGALNRASGMDTIPIYSAILTTDFSHQIEINEAENGLCRRGLNLVLLLLSFANRSNIATHAERFEVRDGNGWRSIGGGNRTFPSLGTVKPTPMNGLDGGIRGFIDRNLEGLMIEKKDNETGIVSALRFLCSNYSKDFIESKYLKTWTAAEILITKNIASNRIVNRSVRKEMRRRIDEGLDEYVDSGTITKEQRDMLHEKVNEFSRMSIARQGNLFFSNTLAGYTEAIPSVDEIRAFANVRNSIAHSGVTPLPSKKDPRSPGQARAQLHGLVERTILALLDERADVFAADWRNHRALF